MRVTFLSQVVVSSSQAPDAEEEALYASPEELLSNGLRATPKSDVYSLGMLFFELFNPSVDSVERKRALEALRHRILPSHVLRVSILHPQIVIYTEDCYSNGARSSHRRLVGNDSFVAINGSLSYTVKSSQPQHVLCRD